MTDELSRRDSDTADGRNRVEQVVVLVAIVLLTATLGYIAWQAVVTPDDGVPVAEIEAVEPMPDDDRQRVTVVLDNEVGRGLTSVEVAVECGSSVRPVTFEHVPAGGQRTATVICPPETTPTAGVHTWVEA